MSIGANADADFVGRTSDLPDDRQFTMCCWFYGNTDNGGSNYSVIQTLESTSGFWAELAIAFSGGGLVTRNFNATSSSILTVSNDTWYFGAQSQNASNHLGYGAAIGDAALSTSSAELEDAFTPDSLKFLSRISGADPSGGHFLGHIAALKIWDAVLTADELELERWFITPQRLADLHFWNPGFDTTGNDHLTDYSGNGRTLTEGGTLTTEEGPPIAWEPQQRVTYFLPAAGGGAFEIDAQPGTFSLTGMNTTLLASRLIDAEPGSYALSGVDATLLHHHALNAETGNFSISGIAAPLLYHRLINAAPGSYVIGGVTATLVWSGEGAFELVCDPGAFTITGVATALLNNRVIDAEPGSFTYTGVNVTLLAQRLIDAAPGAYTLTGIVAELLHHRMLNAEPGSFALTGIDAILVYTPLGGFELVCDPGTFTISGVAATVLAQRLISANAGAFTLSGVAADLQFTRALNAEPGSYLVSGLPMTMLAARLLNAEPGNYALTGADAILLAARVLVAEVGTFTWTGADATILRNALLNAAPGTFTVTGSNAQLVYSAVNLPNVIFFTTETSVTGQLTSEAATSMTLSSETQK